MRLRLASSIVLFPLWFCWPRRSLPLEFEWLEHAWFATLCLTLLVIGYVALFITVAEGAPLGATLVNAAAMWLAAGILFLLRSMIHLAHFAITLGESADGRTA